MKTIIIGDLHGCYDEAIELLKKCDYSFKDKVIFLGDLVDRGKDNDKCMDLAMHLQDVQQSTSCVMGNHEEKHIYYEDYLKKHGKLPDKMSPTHLETRSQLSKKHYDFMRTMPLYLEIPEYNIICVHAGLYPDVPLHLQSKRHLLHIQSIKPGHQESYWASKVPDNTWKYWTNYWKGPQRVVFGHSVLDKPLHNDYVTGIDGGAVFGMQLHALVLPENKIVTIQSKTPKHGRSEKPKYLVQDDVLVYS